MNKRTAALLIIFSLFSVSVALAEKQSQTSIITTESNNYNPVVGQKVTLNYMLAVDGFFNGATRFQLPSLSKARLSQTSSFAINGSTIIDGKKYATQIWQIDLYPEHAGLLEIPIMNFNVQYTDAKGNKQRSTLSSDSLALFSYLPEPLQNIEKYVVSSDVQVTDSWSTSQDSYQVGDIIKRQVSITAADIKSIQIPTLEFSTVDGLQINTQEAKLDDQSNRGEQTAKLTQVVSYVIQQPGRYHLGGEQLTWWNLETGLQQANFETLTVKVEGISPLNKKLLVAFLLLFLIAIFVYFKFRNRPRKITSQLKQAFKRQQWGKFIALLYQKSDKNSELGMLKKGTQAATAGALLDAHYNKKVSNPKQVNISDSQLKNLIK